MEETKNPDFSVQVSLKSTEDQNITISPAETSDGVPYYKCQIEGQEVQLRQDEEMRWELMWGELDEEDVQKLGKAIEKERL